MVTAGDGSEAAVTLVSGEAVAESASGLRAWFDCSVRPFLFAASPFQRSMRLAEIIIVAWAILLARPKPHVGPSQFLYAVAGAAAGFVHFALLSTRFMTLRERPRLLPWRHLGGMRVKGLLAPLLTAATFLVYAAFEEVVWRFALQQHLLGGGALALVAVAVLFSLTHFFPGQPSLAQVTDLVSLSLLLGVLVYATGSLTPAIFMHWTRNLSVLRYPAAGRR